MSSGPSAPFEPRRPPAGDVGSPVLMVPWWCSWPVIVLLEFACVVPAVVLVWLRPLTTPVVGPIRRHSHAQR
jgi:hypothetical protein